MTINNISPLRYPGGKTRACKKLHHILQEHFDLNNFDSIVSPFFGGGSFEFFLQSHYNLKIYANDKFTPLCNFWKCCQEYKNEMCTILYTKINKITKAEFKNMQTKIVTETDLLNQAIMYFMINRSSFSGCTLSGGFSLESSTKRFTKSSIDRISELDLSHIEFLNEDFEEFLQRPFEKCIYFIDPPYYLENKSNLYGTNGDLHESFDHEKLNKCLRMKRNWIVTYNNCDFIRDLYKEYKIIETCWTYGMNSSKKSSEIVIISQT